MTENSSTASFSTSANYIEVKQKVVEQYLFCKEAFKLICNDLGGNIKPSNNVLIPFFSNVLSLHLDLSSKIKSLTPTRQKYYEPLNKLNEIVNNPSLLIINNNASIQERLELFSSSFKLLRDLLEDLGYLKVETLNEELTPELINIAVKGDRTRISG